MKHLLLVIFVLLDVMGCGPRHYVEPDYLEVSPKSIALDNRQSSTATIKVSSNMQWTVATACSSWVEVEPMSGSDIANIRVTAKAANDSPYDRMCTIIVSAGNMQQEVRAYQRGNPAADK